ncbi:DUF1501 domain-containing protein [Sphingomonas pituitosa]|uniref:DUF1501 domain-containing protein n=1 Tax=Sphingomonas pituitosa TaxID=99597 RepID=UPI00082CC260|nr:DUF1501 domain-containing protein [Sphingomonas pituitosa]
MTLSRRDFVRLTAGTGALAAMAQLGRTAAIAAPSGGYRAMVGIFLYGGNDGWNMVVPTDARHVAYEAARGAIALPRNTLTPLTNSSYALHPAMAALRPIWDEGALSLVLNTGTLFAPLNKQTYQSRPDLRPGNLMSHADEQAHWQGLRARDTASDGFLGRIADRMPGGRLPPLISLSGSTLAVIGRQTVPLVVPASGLPSRIGYNERDTAKNLAVAAMAASEDGPIMSATANTLRDTFDQAALANSLLSGPSSVSRYFVDSAGKPLTSDIANQLLGAARMIEARGSLGHNRQSFLVSMGGFDYHANQIQARAPTAGPHAGQLGVLAEAMAAFHRAMQALGLGANVTTFTMSDFGRTYAGNAQNGTDHAWGNNHLVMGGDVAKGGIFGTYPDPVLGGADDITREGRFIPGVAQEEYLGAIARWHGVSDADMPYVFPNWSTWSTAGRGPLPLFRR